MPRIWFLWLMTLINQKRRMNASRKSRACVMRWSAQKVNQNLYAVSATIDGHE